VALNHQQVFKIVQPASLTEIPVVNFDNCEGDGNQCLFQPGEAVGGLDP